MQAERCRCGRERRDGARSCAACLERQRASNRRQVGPVAKLRSLLRTARERSVRSGIPFAIALSDLDAPAFCPVLGIALDYAVRGRHRDASPSIDRFVGSLGYVRGNVRVISWRANRLKSDGTPEELAAVAAYANGHNARTDGGDFGRAPT